MIKILLSSLKEYKKTSLITIMLSILEVIIEIIIPLLMADLLDQGITGGHMNVVYKYGIALFMLALLELAVGFMGAMLGAKASVGLSANLREDMYDRIQNFAFSNIDKFSSASLVTRLTTDITNVQNAYQMLIRMAIRSPFMMLFAMIASFRINVSIALIFLAIIPILAIALLLIVYKVNPIFHRVFHTYDQLNNVVQENVNGIRVVKSFNREDFEEKKFKGVSQKVYEDYAKGERLIALNSPIMQLCMYIAMIMISYIGALAIVKSGNVASIGLTTGDLTALFSYATQILMSLMVLSMIFAMLTIANSSMERICEVLQETTDIKESENPVKTVRDGSVVFDHVSFAYSKTQSQKVLDDINLTIPSGSVIGIIGGTGSSKSSLVSLIPRLYDVTGGHVLVGGVDVRNYDLQTLRDQVSMVLQKNELFSGTIKENLRWGNAHASDEEIKKACQIACADEFINTMPQGYDTMIDQGGTNVSGGQKQRLCIARALLKKPKILILDDSTSAVDTKTDAKIQKALAQSLPETTKIVIAQRISSVEHADRIIVLDHGHIDAIGTHEELLKSCAIYQEVYAYNQKED